MELFWKYIPPGILFLLTLAFGVWLSRSGKPYNGLLFNVHKLIALGAVVVTVVQLSRTLNSAVSTQPITVLLTLAAIGVITLFASGALMSANKSNYRVMLTIHQAGPVLTILALGLVIYLLERTQ